MNTQPKVTESCRRSELIELFTLVSFKVLLMV